MTESRRSVVDRAIQLLDCFDVDATCLSLAELCERANLPKSTVYRLAEQLVRVGWLERSEAGYAVGVGLSVIGDLAQRHFRIRRTAAVRLPQLAAVTGVAGFLMIRDGNDVECLELAPVRGWSSPLREGDRIPMLACAAGRALASRLPPAEQGGLLAAPLPRRTPFTRVLPAVLERELARVAQVGVAYEREETFRAVASIAVAIDAQAAIMIAGPAGRLDAPRLAAAVQGAARSLRRDLAGTGTAMHASA